MASYIKVTLQGETESRMKPRFLRRLYESRGATVEEPTEQEVNEHIERVRAAQRAALERKKQGN